jgi:adenylate cyclase
VSEAPIERRLAAILATDVVGYSRLMGADEVGTLRALRRCRRELIDPAIAARHGRIVKTTGDGMLIEFASAVDAVACAITVQQGAANRDRDLSEDRRLVFRVGINLGDIISEENDIFGDGVNVAARLESLCEPGGICISRAVRDQVRDKLPVAFDDLGEQTVKNIARPVRVFGLAPPAIAAAPPLTPNTRAVPSGRRRRAMAAALAAVAVVAAGGGAGWWLIRGPEPPPAALGGTGSPAAPTASVAATRASIAVLPFISLGAETAGDYFADGLTEDIIAALGRFRELSVMARAAVFAYKSRNPTPSEVGRDLGVRYVVEGSVRRSPERLRVSVSLTDTSRGAVLWSDQYDAELKDIFSVQDQITRRISGALAVRVTSLEQALSAAKPPDNLEAYDLVLQGRAFAERLTRAATAQARDFFERALELDPNYAAAYIGLGNVDLAATLNGWRPDPVAALERAEALAKKAIALDPLNPGAHALLGRIALSFGEYDRALDALKRAIDLNSSDPQSYGALLNVLLFRGDVEGAIAAGEKLAEFQPDFPQSDAFHLAVAYVLADRASDAVRVLERTLDRNPEFLYAKVALAASYAAIGRQRDAERQSTEVKQRFPTFSSQEFGSLLRDPAQREKLAGALKRAGF